VIASQGGDLATRRHFPIRGRKKEENAVKLADIHAKRLASMLAGRIEVVAEEQKKPVDTNRILVVSYMHYKGDHYGALSDDQMWEIYCMADGFGSLSSNQLMEINDGWDWSHVRDSTSEAFASMAQRLVELGFGPEGPAAGRKP
jgi:hypothetical protein